MRLEDVLDDQVNLIKYWRSPEGMRMMAAWVESQDKKYGIRGHGLRDHDMGIHGEAEPARAASRRQGLHISQDYRGKQDRPKWNVANAAIDRAAYEARLLDNAQTFYVTSDMIDVIRAFADKMADEPLLKTDPPSECGFVVFEKSLVTTDIHHAKVSFRALSWGPAEIAFASNDPDRTDEHNRKGVSVTWYTDRHDIAGDDSLLRWATADPDEWRAYTRGLPRWMLLHYMGMAFGVNYAGRLQATLEGEIENTYGQTDGVGTLTEDGAMRIDSAEFAYRRLIQAFWRLIQQRIAIPKTRKPPRAQVRRLQRMGSILPKEIQVVVLRRAESHHEASEFASEPVNWTHRWMVQGHVRNQWYPSLGPASDPLSHRQIWVPAYVKGPEDRPLLIKDRIHHVKR